MKKLIPSISVLLMLVAWAALNWPALISLHWRWIKLDEAYAIGYPVCLIVLWLIIEQRQSIQRNGISPSASAGLLFVLLIAIGQAARLVQFQLLQQLIVPASLWLLIVNMFGWRNGRLVLLPLALLYLAIPFWDVVIAPLRWFTLTVTQHALILLNTPAYIAGYEITLPAGKIIIEDGCSGLNLFLAASVIGLLQFHLMLGTFWRRGLVVVTALAIGIVDNWVRVIIIVLVGHFSAMQSPLVYHHGNFGWAVFVVGLVPFFFVARWLERGARKAPAPVSAAIQAAMPYQRMALYGASAVAGGLLLLTVTALLEQRTAQPTAWPTPPLAVSVQPEWLPHYAGYDQQQAWRIDVDQTSYEVLVLTYLHQEKDKKLIYYNNWITDVAHLKSTRRFAFDHHVINEAVIDREGGRVVWWFYLIDGQVVGDGLRAKVYQLIGLMRGDPSASLVTISTRCAYADCRDALRAEQTVAADKLLHGLFTVWLPKD